MSEQGPTQQTRPPRGNSYDREPPPYYAPWPAKVPEYKVVDPNQLYISIAKAAGIAVLVAGAMLYARDFQHETQSYQQSMTSKMGEMVKAMQDMTTSRDLSDFCMQAQAENINWKCPSAFVFRRQGYVSPPKQDKVRIQLGSR